MTSEAKSCREQGLEVTGSNCWEGNRNGKLEPGANPLPLQHQSQSTKPVIDSQINTNGTETTGVVYLSLSLFLLNIKIAGIFKCQKREKQIHPSKRWLNGYYRFFLSFSVLGLLCSLLMHALDIVSGLLTLAFVHFPQVVVRETLQSNQKVALELQNAKTI